MVTINITEEQREKAKERMLKHELRNSVTKGDGNYAGALGEIILIDRYKKHIIDDNTYDFDLKIKGKKIEVKTKRQNNAPQSNYTYNIFAFNTKQVCDYYCFIGINYENTEAWIAGWITKEDFLEKSEFRKKGEVDNNNPRIPFTFKGDCYCILQSKLIK